MKIKYTIAPVPTMLMVRPGRSDLVKAEECDARNDAICTKAGTIIISIMLPAHANNPADVALPAAGVVAHFSPSNKINV